MLSNNLLQPFIFFSLFMTLITISLFAWAFLTGSFTWRKGSVPIPGLKGLPVLGSMLSLCQGLAHRSLASIASHRAGLNKQLMAFSWCMLMVVMVVVVPSLALVEDKEIGFRSNTTVTFDLTDGVTSYQSFLTNLHRDAVGAPTRGCGLPSTPSIGVRSNTTVTFDLRDGVTSYQSFLTNLRDAVRAPARVCGLQSTRRTPLQGAEYIYVNLKINDTHSVTLGADVTNMYVWGYQDNFNYNGGYRASFLQDAPLHAKKNLFRGSTYRNTTFGGNYNDLERAAHKCRRDLVIGIENLIGAIITVYGKQDKVKPKQDIKGEAKFFLIAIQMVAEAARFKFMEKAIVDNDIDRFKGKMVAFQNNWNKISEVIHAAKAETNCTDITPPLVIRNSEYNQTVGKVDEIKNDMGLLKFKEKSL